MKRRIVIARRVRDNAQIEVTELVPETPEDEAEIERLDALGLISRGDSFPEQEEHERLRAERVRELRSAANGS